MHGHMNVRKGVRNTPRNEERTVFADCSRDISNHKPFLSNTGVLLTYQTFTIIRANAINYLYELHSCQRLVADCTSLSCPVSAEINDINIKVVEHTLSPPLKIF